MGTRWRRRFPSLPSMKFGRFSIPLSVPSGFRSVDAFAFRPRIKFSRSIMQPIRLETLFRVWSSSPLPVTFGSTIMSILRVSGATTLFWETFMREFTGPSSGKHVVGRQRAFGSF